MNSVVEDVETSPELLRVDDLCERFGVGERTLQRLLHKRIGLGPKWLIRRRRLQEAADRLRDSGVELAGVAAELGYADQAHFTRDFRRASGLTPGEFAARFPAGWREPDAAGAGRRSVGRARRGWRGRPRRGWEGRRARWR